MDSWESLIAKVEAEGEDVPESVKAKGDDAVKAFIEMRKEKKAVVDAFKKQKEELDSLRKEKAVRDATTQQQSSGQGNGSNDSADGVWAKLEQQAMVNLGITAIKSDSHRNLVGAEAQRLYIEGMNQLQAVNRLTTTAPQIVAKKLAAYGLDDAGIAEVGKRLESVPLLQRVEDDTIRTEVYKYVGEKQITGGGEDEGSSDEPPADPDAGGDAFEGDVVPGADTGSRSPKAASAAKVAAASVRGGRSDIAVNASVKRKSTGTKPPSAEELREMRKLGITDIVAYRYAKERKENYRGH